MPLTVPYDPPSSLPGLLVSMGRASALAVAAKHRADTEEAILERAAAQQQAIRARQLLAAAPAMANARHTQVPILLHPRVMGSYDDEHMSGALVESSPIQPGWDEGMVRLAHEEHQRFLEKQAKQTALQAAWQEAAHLGQWLSETKLAGPFSAPVGAMNGIRRSASMKNLAGAGLLAGGGLAAAKGIQVASHEMSKEPQANRNWGQGGLGTALSSNIYGQPQL